MGELQLCIVFGNITRSHSEASMATDGDRIITKSFRIALRVSNFLGLSLVHYSKSSGNFEFELKSSATIICIVACVIRILLTLQYGSDFILRRPLATARWVTKFANLWRKQSQLQS